MNNHCNDNNNTVRVPQFTGRRVCIFFFSCLAHAHSRAWQYVPTRPDPVWRRCHNTSTRRLGAMMNWNSNNTSTQVLVGDGRRDNASAREVTPTEALHQTMSGMSISSCTFQKNAASGINPTSPLPSRPLLCSIQKLCPQLLASTCISRLHQPTSSARHTL